MCGICGCNHHHDESRVQLFEVSALKNTGMDLWREWLIKK